MTEPVIPKNKDLEAAIRAALEAGRIQMDAIKSMSTSTSTSIPTSINIEKKADRSPVTDVDRRCEERIKGIILKKFPNDGFLGEESGEINPSSARRWIVDPLDGTRPFIRGIPTHSVLIALEENGTPTVGVIHLPAMGMGVTCYASRGNGAYIDGERIGVSRTGKLEDAMGSVLGITEYADEPLGRRLIGLMRAWDYSYGFMDAYSYVLLACGKLDVCVNLLDKPWDCAAAACIVTEAGGRFSDVGGVETVHGGSIVLTNGVLHDEVLGALR